MELKKVNLKDIAPYKNNPRKNEEAVVAVMDSIRQCEYVAPIIVDENMEILAGHTRYKALLKLGKTEENVIIKEGLTEEQKRKYRYYDNRTNELAEWDLDILSIELNGLDLGNLDYLYEQPQGENEIDRKECLITEDTYQIIIDCDSEEDMQNKYESIRKVGIDCRISTL